MKEINTIHAHGDKDQLRRNRKAEIKEIAEIQEKKVLNYAKAFLKIKNKFRKERQEIKGNLYLSQA